MATTLTTTDLAVSIAYTDSTELRLEGQSVYWGNGHAVKLFDSNDENRQYFGPLGKMAYCTRDWMEALSTAHSNGRIRGIAVSVDRGDWQMLRPDELAELCHNLAERIYEEEVRQVA